MTCGIATPDPVQENGRLTIGAAMETRRTEIKLTNHNDTLVSHNDAFAEFNKWNSNGGPHRQYVDQITRQDLLTFKKHIVDTGRDLLLPHAVQVVVATEQSLVYRVANRRKWELNCPS
jgi:hypothetical protein